MLVFYFGIMISHWWFISLLLTVEQVVYWFCVIPKVLFIAGGDGLCLCVGAFAFGKWCMLICSRITLTRVM